MFAMASPTVAAQAAPDEQKETVNCALIRDGIQRLACYDAQNDPIWNKFLKHFNIKNDFNDEEMERIKKENEWCEGN